MYFMCCELLYNRWCFIECFKTAQNGTTLNYYIKDIKCFLKTKQPVFCGQVTRYSKVLLEGGICF